jgi:putative restriction endonuclease
VRLVQSWSEVEKNLLTLEAARHSKDESVREYYTALIKRGTCFLAYQSSEGVAFALSKFVGYIGNGIETHMQVRRERDGRDS